LFREGWGAGIFYYGYTDNQGSLIALTDAAGNVVEKYAYDPWGARRNPQDWTQKGTPPSEPVPNLFREGWGAGIFYYGYTDNQGSLIALTDAAGNVVEKYAYDPWGARRNPQDWAQKDNRTSWILSRGYTGHSLSRFLSGSTWMLLALLI